MVTGIIEASNYYLLISLSCNRKLRGSMGTLRLKLLRASLELTQKELATSSKISEKTLADIERGKTRPRPITAYLIVTALNEKLKAVGREEITVDSLDWSPL